MTHQRAAEAKNLTKAQTDLSEGERRIARQRVLIEELRASGLDVSEAEKSILRLEEGVKEWRAHRDVVSARLAEIDAQAATIDKVR